MSAWVPVLRAACDPPSAFAAAAQHPARGLVRRLAAPGLHALLAADLGDRLRFVTIGELREAGVPLGAAFATALAALEPAAGLVALGDGVFQISDVDGLAASRLLLPGFLPAFADTVGGTPVAAVPHSRAVWVASEQHAPALLERAIAAWQREGTPISPLVYGEGRSGLEVWGPKELRVQWAWAALRHRIYRRVREALEALFESPRFAPTRLLEREGVWGLVSVVSAEALPMLVPAGEWVLLEQGESSMLTELPTLARRGGWAHWPGLEPPWWLVRQWPLS